MKPIAALLAVLSLPVVLTGCATANEDSCCGKSRYAESRPQADQETVAEKVGVGLCWLGQSALYSAAKDTAQTEAPFPH